VEGTTKFIIKFSKYLILDPEYEILLESHDSRAVQHPQVDAKENF
jgi:hypothetical protein